MLLDSKSVHKTNIVFFALMIIMSLKQDLLSNMVVIICSLNAAFNIFIYPGLFYYYVCKARL